MPYHRISLFEKLFERMFSKSLSLPGIYSVSIILTGGNTSNNSDEKNHFGRTEHENISALLLSGQSIPSTLMLFYYIPVGIIL